MAQWKNRIIGLDQKPANQFNFNPLNWRKHPDQQREILRTLLGDVGWVTGVIENIRTGNLIDGHARIEEALRDDPTQLIPYIKVDLSQPEEKLVLATLDPVSALAETSVDDLDTLLEQLVAETPDLENLLSELHAFEARDADDGDDEDILQVPAARAALAQRRWKVKPGDVWEIGNHRLLCGDSQDPALLTRLLAGAKPDLLNTDPPYGINIVHPIRGQSTASVGGSKPFGSTSSTARKSSTSFGRVQRGPKSKNQIIQSNVYPVIHGDDHPFDPRQLLNHAPIVVLWGANYYSDKLPISSRWFCWDKREGITRNSFADCELAWCSEGGVARVFHHLWNGIHKGSQHDEPRSHPTEKPIALFREIGELLAPRGLWLDTYAGTGAQILAAEQAAATCYAVEIVPEYCAMALERASTRGLDCQVEPRKKRRA